ncbi:MAG: hypothetical protein Q4G63_03315 [Bacteroidia bacterium]|nr:hypothetical protein [Bacteroidia bacterium]
MKKLFTILPLMALVILSVSCKKDTPRISNTIADSSELAFVVKPIKGSNTASKELKLTDFSKVTSAKVTPTRATVSNVSFISVTGIKNKLELSNLTIQVKDNKTLSHSLGKVAKDQTFKSPQEIAFLQKIVNEMLKTKSTKLDLVVTASEKLDSDIKITLKLNVNFQKK